MYIIVSTVGFVHHSLLHALHDCSFPGNFSMEVISGTDEGDDLVHVVVAGLAAGTGGEAIDLARGHLDAGATS